MSVYLDTQGHLIADSRDELHAFAQRIGLRRRWFQDRTRLWHYDVMSHRVREIALRRGAVSISPRETVRILDGLSRAVGSADTEAGG